MASACAYDSSKPAGVLQPFGESIWTVAEVFRMPGAAIPVRSTVVRLADGGLWVHAPLGVDAGFRSALDALGTVRHIVAPSRMHYLGVRALAACYPEARVYGTAALRRKHPEIAFGSVLGEDAPEWAAEIGQAPVRGNPFLDEFLFFHRASRMLIVTDLLMSADAESPPSWRRLGKLLGFYGRPGVPIEIRLSFFGRAAAREMLRKLRSWEVERIVMCHGRPIERDGAAVVERALRFVGRS